MNPALRTTFDWLRVQGLPPLPVAPAQDPTRYPARDRNGSLKRDKDGALVPAFTGKNPSFLDQRGIPHLIRHTQYQNRMPTQAELQTWFAHPDNGIGTLGGWHNIVWVDVDVKQLESQQACDQRITDWLSQYPLLQQTFTERTHSGGWRLAVRVQEKTFTNFSLDGVGGHHMGEALGQGRFTVLSPTIGPSGKAYVNVQRVPPVWVERLDAIGLYPASGRREQRPSRQPRPLIQPQPAQPGVLRLEDLATAKAQAVLHGDSPLASRSHSLTYALREFYGWENWAAQNRVPISGNAEELARAAGAALGLDDDRIERIIQSIPNPDLCTPATVFMGNEISAWKQIWKIDQRAYHDHCPDEIQQAIREAIPRNCRRTLEIASNSVPRQNDPTQVREIKIVSRHALSAAKKPIGHDEPLEVLNYSGQTENADQSAGLGKQQIQTFVSNARYILSHSTSVLVKANDDFFQGSMALQRQSVHGRIYHLEAEGLQLRVQARGRGTIFKVSEGVVELSKLTVSDIHCFQAEVNRLKQQQIAGRTALTHARTLEM